MADMRCSLCGRYGIYWRRLTHPDQHTFCPHCKGTNCQEFEETEEPTP